MDIKNTKNFIEDIYDLLDYNYYVNKYNLQNLSFSKKEIIFYHVYLGFIKNKEICYNSQKNNLGNQIISKLHTLLNSQNKLPLMTQHNFKTANRIINNKMFKINSVVHKYIGPFIKNKPSKIYSINSFNIKQCVFHRVNKRINYLNEHVFDYNKLQYTEVIKMMLDIKMLIIYRAYPNNNILFAISLCNYLNIPVFYEVDDLIFTKDYPSTNILYYRKKMKDMLINNCCYYNSLIKLCDYCIVSTPYLLNIMKPLVKKKDGFIIKNSLPSDFKYNCSIVKKKHNQINICYVTGTLTNILEFKNIIIPSIFNILHKFNNVKFYLLGKNKLKDILIPQHIKKRIFYLGYIKPEKVNLYIKQMHISLAILFKNNLNNSKSELKVIESITKCVYPICSDTPIYIDLKSKYPNLLSITDCSVSGLTEKISECIYNKLYAQDKFFSDRDKFINKYSFNTQKIKCIYDIKKIYKRHNKKRKIAIVSVWFPPDNYGGATLVIKNNVDYILDNYTKDYELCAFTTVYKDNIKDIPFNTHYIDSYRNMNVYRFRVRTNIKYRSYRYNEKYIDDSFTFFLQQEKPDIVHFHCLQCITARPTELCKKFNIKYLVTVHDSWWICDHIFLYSKLSPDYSKNTHLKPIEYFKPSINREITVARTNYLQKMLNNAVNTLSVSKKYSNLYRKCGINNVLTISNGIDIRLKYEKNHGNGKKVVIGFAGGMTDHKGYNILSKCIKENFFPKLKFLIVNTIKPTDYIRNYKVNNNEVQFIGFQENKQDLFNKMNVCICLSLWEESFCLISREAQKTGCWVIGSSYGSVSEDIKDKVDGFIIEPTYENLLDKLLEINNNPNKFLKSIKSKYIKSSSDQTIEIIELYKKILQ